MEEFRKVIQKRNIMLRVAFALILVLNLILYTIQKDSPQFEEGVSFQMGVLIGFEFLGCLLMYRYGIALKDDKSLKKLYIEEHDERKRMIKEKMSQSAIWTSIFILLLAGSVMAYVDQMIAMTLIGSVLVIMIVMILFKAYYRHKY